MIDRDKAGRFTVHCDKCGHAMELTGVSTFDDARSVLSRDGWLEAARKGKGRDRWLWWCPGCAPHGAPHSFGRST